MGKNLVSGLFDSQCRDPNAGNSHVSLTIATIIKDRNAGSSQFSSTPGTVELHCGSNKSRHETLALNQTSPKY